MSDLRDIHHGVNDPVTGADVKAHQDPHQTPHELVQGGADVRAPASPAAEPFLPERLRRDATDPLNARTGRRPTD